ncbi:hypothetical protein MMC14_007739 [Varicellaria rhodocarpa]|nr:hypothetical protein [Varicellaria rhodocarpa]
MSTTSSPQAGPDIFHLSSFVGAATNPVFLLKTRSQPTDAYHEYFTSFKTIPKCVPISVPVLQHAFPTSSLSTLRSLILILPSQYSGLIFTSQRAVEAFASVVTSLANEELNPSHSEAAEALKALRLPFYTVGLATSRALNSLRDAYLPSCSVVGKETGNGENLARYILRHHPRSLSSSEHPLLPLLFLVGEQRRDIIPKTLTSPTLPSTSRIPVSELVVYETQVMASFAEEFVTTLRATSSAATRWVVVFSPAGCESMLRVLGWLDEGTGKTNLETGKNVFVASIGPTTREYLEREFGFRVDVCAETPSPEGVGEGIRRFMMEKKETG